MILARLAVYGAILCTLWFNGSYAWSKGGSEVHQYGMVAVAITIDLCKCGFLTGASYLWRSSWFIPAIVLVLLWPLTFAYSLFSGYASISSNRSATTSIAEGQSQQRSRTQAQYDDAAAAIKLAKTSPLWTTTAACTAPKTDKQRDFCGNIETTTHQQTAAATLLNASPPTRVDPEVTALKDSTDLPMPTLMLLIAAWPALILELVSSLGFYAINRRPSPKAPKTLAEGFSRFGRRRMADTLDKLTTALPVASGESVERPTLVKPKPSTTNPKLDWTVP